jgi:hypothetical protein
MTTSAEGKWPKRIRAEMVFRAVKGIVDSGREKEFLELCEREDIRAALTVPDINLVKTFFENNEQGFASGLRADVLDSNKCT